MQAIVDWQQGLPRWQRRVLVYLLTGSLGALHAGARSWLEGFVIGALIGLLHEPILVVLLKRLSYVQVLAERDRDGGSLRGRRRALAKGRPPRDAEDAAALERLVRARRSAATDVRWSLVMTAALGVLSCGLALLVAEAGMSPVAFVVVAVGLFASSALGFAKLPRERRRLDRMHRLLQQWPDENGQP